VGSPQRGERTVAMASIKQNRQLNALPDFRNLGVILRILTAVLLLSLTAAAVNAASFADWVQRWIAMLALLAPIAISSLLLLAAAGPWLQRLDYRLAIALIIAVELAITSGALRVSSNLLGLAPGSLVSEWFLAAAATIAVLGYFDLRNRALSPAVIEARLQALQARIRPHFFFNSINAVLSLVRSEPRRAEEALHDLAELFRVIMADNRDLIPLRRELEICEQYLGIEQLRLGERLKVEWKIDRMPADAMVPPLLLQPVVENAVYHGIEPASEQGTVTVAIHLSGETLHIHLRNPYRGESRHQSGNRMALSNIRERLQLHFDAEARLVTRAGDSFFEVDISLPYVREKR
jgi:two-component system, LytTR family, sensor histidine kinase AlgZ